MCEITRHYNGKRFADRLVSSQKLCIVGHCALNSAHG